MMHRDRNDVQNSYEAPYTHVSVFAGRHYRYKLETGRM
ncbi:hypothetical protein BofuT4_uP090290.1 [Botrytis cinerea T4]|uniref:Uncharacterized protein n=1 Tax=Botryotinia fuckeliana (strain T4) TaxID=999810 RepID=G2YEU9_BOTF4|nr:hypothetical protein BofuT4_uP090290.1 [Botrytis cinerea T4]